MKIIILGGGTAGWITASYFTSKNYQVTLIESKQIPIIGVGESTIPTLLQFMEDVGLTEDDLFTNCNSVRKYAIKHHNWTKRKGSWWHVFGSDESTIDEQLIWMNKNVPIDFKLRRHAYHLDAHLFGQTLKEKVCSNVNHIFDNIIDVEINDNGIEKLMGLKSTYSADLYIDCSGFKKILRGKFTTNTKGHSSIINNCAIVGPSLYDENSKLNNFTETYAMDYGWRWRISLQHRAGNGYVFSKDFISIDQASEEFVKKTPNLIKDNISVVHFDNSYELNPWIKNVVSVGLSSGFLEPLEATGIFLIHGPLKFIERLLHDPNRQEKYNRVWRKIYSHIADFISLQYETSDLDHTEYWRSLKKVRQVDTSKASYDFFTKYNYRSLAKARQIPFI